MKLNEKITELLKVYKLAKVSDFINSDSENIDFYLEETNLDRNEIEHLSDKYEGYGMCSIEESIILELNKYL